MDKKKKNDRLTLFLFCFVFVFFMLRQTNIFFYALLTIYTVQQLLDKPYE